MPTFFSSFFTSIRWSSGYADFRVAHRPASKFSSHQPFFRANSTSRLKDVTCSHQNVLDRIGGAQMDTESVKRRSEAKAWWATCVLLAAIGAFCSLLRPQPALTPHKAIFPKCLSPSHTAHPSHTLDAVGGFLGACWSDQGICRDSCTSTTRRASRIPHKQQAFLR